MSTTPATPGWKHNFLSSSSSCQVENWVSLQWEGWGRGACTRGECLWWLEPFLPTVTFLHITPLLSPDFISSCHWSQMELLLFFPYAYWCAVCLLAGILAPWGQGAVQAILNPQRSLGIGTQNGRIGCEAQGILECLKRKADATFPRSQDVVEPTGNGKRICRFF